MATTTEMAEEFSKILNRPVHSPYHLHDLVRNEEEALKVGKLLETYISVADNLQNPDVKEVGARMLKRTYDSLCKKFSVIKTEVREPYDIPPYKKKKRR